MSTCQEKVSVEIRGTAAQAAAGTNFPGPQGPAGQAGTGGSSGTSGSSGNSAFSILQDGGK